MAKHGGLAMAQHVADDASTHGDSIGISKDHGGAGSADDRREREAPPEPAAALLALLRSAEGTNTSSSSSLPPLDRSVEFLDPQEAPKRDAQPVKKRKPTLTVRKEEMTALLEEMQHLEARLTDLRRQVVAPQAVSQPDSTDEHQHSVSPLVANTLLREVLHTQQLRFAGTRAMVSQYYALELGDPMHLHVHLRADRSQRRATMQRLKPLYLRYAHRFILERSRHLDLTRPHSTSERFVTRTGDCYGVRFHIHQLPSAWSVRDVYEATVYYAMTLEIGLTDIAGLMTVREDDDSGELGMSQHRLASTTEYGVVVDTNTLVFAHYEPDGDYGLLTATFVDHDDLYPYRPAERVLHEVSSTVLITRGGDGAVVVRRWDFSRHSVAPELTVDDEVWRLMCECVGNWSDHMMQVVRERVAACVATQ